MNVLFVAAECAPYAKTGGLADVVGALPRFLRALGHEVIVVMPRYRSIDAARHGLRWFHAPMGVWMGDTEEWCAVHTASNRGVPVYFVESQKYFDRWGLYHDERFNDYADNPRRFGFLTRAALQLCKDIGFKPDIVHAHDWHTALAPAYLKVWHWNDPLLGSAASVLTIHNLAYQGKYPAYHLDYLGLQWSNFTPDKFEDHGAINFLKGGIVYADLVTTVSPTYARETRTPEGGFGLAPYLNAKGDDYLGILNGCDYEVWNPETDPLIPARYSAEDLRGKAVCKRALQARMHLEVADDIPIVGVVSRFVEQKGLHLLAQCIEGIVQNMRVQFAILGSGDPTLEHVFGTLPARYPGRIGSYIGYNEELAHWIEAGADFFLMPSLYEPCGLNQMYSLRYGTLPIVRATGGLEDTVMQYDERSGEGTGFKFYEASAHAVYYTVGWAISTYYDRPHHMQRLIRNAMAQDFSWERSARAYEAAYARAIENKQRWDRAHALR
ncbi:MAG: glycogen synthase GlgA [Anaerolineae bacterium]|nr:glycogen synthase GlgA [Thermoflexales bacterium]MDW8053420.1 glycogen synthase GlgA [Anaerolineae bacterium]